MNQSQRIIEIIVTPDGKTTVQTKGFAGSSCRDATRQLARALGEVAGEEFTPEFYLNQTAQHNNRTQNGRSDD